MGRENCTIKISPEIYDLIKEVSEKKGITEVNAMLRAFALLSIQNRMEKEGKTLAIARRDASGELYVVGEITGL